MRSSGYPIVLTADRTLMSEYGGGIFLGFSACLPRGTVPDWIYYSLLCPPLEPNRDGSVNVAPCGLRKVQSALLGQGFTGDEVIVAHPDHLEKVVGPSTKIVGCTENDPLGIGPATSTFTQIMGGEPQMRLKFNELVHHPAIQKYRPKIVVGGPGAWQLVDPAVRQRSGVDCVVVGEAETVVAPLFRKLLAGEAVPGLVMGAVTPPQEIPRLRHATLDGIVEIARGCGRGCEFCVPQLQKFRSLLPENILHDVRTNARAGRQPCLHAEDVLRYGARSIEVDEERVVGLFQAVKDQPGVSRVSVSHFALASVASAPRAVERISEILELGGEQWLGGQTGMETGSPALMARYMSGKCRPFKCEEWGETVVQGFQVLEQNHWVPCATIIMGLPGETERDVLLTNDLVDRVHGFRSLVVPLFFVATGELNDGSSFDLKGMSRAHNELFLNCWEHNLRWGTLLLEEWSHRTIPNGLMRILFRLACSIGTSKVYEDIRFCRERYDADVSKIVAAYKAGELSMETMTALAILQMIKKKMHGGGSVGPLPAPPRPFAPSQGNDKKG